MPSSDTPSTDTRRRALRAAMPTEFFFNVLNTPTDYVRGQSSVIKRLAAIDATKITPPKTEAQTFLYRIDQKLSMIVSMMAEKSSRKSYLYHGKVEDISETGLGFGHSMDIAPGAILEIGLKLPNSDAPLMDIAGKVVNVKDPDDPEKHPGYIHLYGVSFFDILGKDQNEIVQWIFTHQREQIRRRRENLEVRDL